MRLRPALQSRHYASDQSHGDRDITKGFPTPQKSNHTPGQATNNSQNPSKLHSETQPKSSPVSSRPKNVSPTPRRNQSKDAAQPLSQQAAIPEASTANAGDALIEDQGSNSLPVPPNVLAAYRTPLRHKATHGIPVASLQLRSYSVRNLEFFADFALRAAFYLNLPASGPVPLPKITERWTMPRSNFVHKKSQENFERITRRRLITIMDGEKSAVEVWLAFLRKWQFYGVGMKANVWEFEGLGKALFHAYLFRLLLTFFLQMLQVKWIAKWPKLSRNWMISLPTLALTKLQQRTRVWPRC